MSKTQWNIDASHSEIGFKVKHMMFTNVSGKFERFQANAAFNEEAFNEAEVEFTADIDSLSTGQPDRDAHLKSGDFFNAEQHPTLHFKSSAIEPASGNQYKMTGDLTIMAQTHPVTLDVEFAGVAKDPWGNTKAGFAINGKINRKQWGLNWNAALETGGLLVGEEVKLNMDVQLTKA